MKTSFYVLTVGLFALTLTSCSLLGKNIQMDSEEAIQTIKETIATNSDLAGVKITQISWSEDGGSNQLENNLGSILVYWADENNQGHSLAFWKNDKGEFVPQKVSNASDVFYEYVKGIDVNNLDAAKIIKQINDAKPLVGDEYDYKSVSSYSIEEELLHMSTKEIQEKNSFFKGFNPDDYGAQSASFVLNVLKKGEGTEQNGRMVTTTYYEIPFLVNEDNSVQVNEK